jgi:hypothetical protein
VGDCAAPALSEESKVLAKGLKRELGESEKNSPNADRRRKIIIN